jgi:curved DNA-binding protein CbpA
MPEYNLYEILQVQPSADSEIIQAAYRRLILRYHPDRNDSADAQEMTQRLNRAYEILSDPKRRTAYDRDSSGTSGERSY